MQVPPRSRQRYIKQIVNALDYDFSRFALEDFIDYLSRRRTRPLKLVHWPTKTPKAMGCWLVRKQVDVIALLYPEGTHPLLLEHIGLHEVAHVLLDHTPQSIGDMTTPEFVTFMYHRNAKLLEGRQRSKDDEASDYINSPEEIEAEYMADVLARRVLLERESFTYHGQLSTIAGFDAIVEHLSFFERTIKPDDDEGGDGDG